jgi:hypothetical protein
VSLNRQLRESCHQLSTSPARAGGAVHPSRVHFHASLPSGGGETVAAASRLISLYLERACLSFIEHRRVALSELFEQAERMGLHGRIACLDVGGNVMAPEPPPAELRAQSLTSMRKYLIANTDARVFAGGKRSAFTGAAPGLLEEAIMAVRARQPIYLAGGFGGITLDIARTLGVDRDDWFPKLPNPAPSRSPGTGCPGGIASCCRLSSNAQTITAASPD